MKGAETPLEGLFVLTKPRDARLARMYKEALITVLELPVDQRQLRSFKRQKKSGGERTITPATRELRMVQYVLSMWLRDNFPKSADYCYTDTGKGVLAAVVIHRESHYAIVCDLKDAFDHVTWDMLYRKIKLYQPSIEERVVEEITNLLTFGKTAPQGCVSTPHVFNLVMADLDKNFQDLVAVPLDLNVTRYSDDMCFSSGNPFNMDFCEAQIGRFVKGAGFEISWIKKFANEPIEYLGTRILNGEISLADESLWKFCNILDEAISSYHPREYEKTVRGIENWAKRVCEGKIPPILQRRIERYRQRLKEMEPLF